MPAFALTETLVVCVAGTVPVDDPKVSQEPPLVVLALRVKDAGTRSLLFRMRLAAGLGVAAVDNTIREGRTEIPVSVPAAVIVPEPLNVNWAC